MNDKFDPYKIVTDRIIEYFENGDRINRPHLWAKNGMPINGFTGRSYNGMNVLLLWIECMEHNYSQPIFLTFNQVKQLQDKVPEDEPCKVRKGEKSIQICFWSNRENEREDPDTGQKTKKKVFLLRLYRVFNVDQLELGEKGREFLLRKNKGINISHKENKIEILEEFVESLGSKVTHSGDRAFYLPTTDEIYMPPFNNFVNAETYYAVRFHEEAHRTGHQSRLNRDLTNRFGDVAYAFEELIAELTSAFLCADFNIAQAEWKNFAEYVTVWTKKMREDAKAIFRASSDARKAVEWMYEQQNIE